MVISWKDFGYRKDWEMMTPKNVSSFWAASLSLWLLEHDCLPLPELDTLWKGALRSGEELFSSENREIGPCPRNQLCARILETNLASHWEGVRLPRASGKSPGLPRKFPELPRKFSATSPEVLSLWNWIAIQRFPGKFPRLPRQFLGLPRKFPGLPRRSAVSLGSLTPSSDSQKLSLSIAPSVPGCP